MTCDEFKANYQRPVLEMTRAERAGVIQHWRGCKACLEVMQKWLSEPSPLPPEEVEHLEQKAQALLMDDVQDPEFYQQAAQEGPTNPEFVEFNELAKKAEEKAKKAKSKKNPP